MTDPTIPPPHDFAMELWRYLLIAFRLKRSLTPTDSGFISILSEPQDASERSEIRQKIGDTLPIW